MMWVAGDVSYHLIHDNVIHSWYFFDHIKSNKNDMWQKHCVCSESRFQHCNSMTLKLIFSWFPLGGEKNVSQTRWNTPNGQIWTNTPWSAHAALIWFWEYKTSSHVRWVLRSTKVSGERPKVPQWECYIHRHARKCTSHWERQGCKGSKNMGN